MEPEPEQELELRRPPDVHMLCEQGWKRHGGGGSGAMAARSYLTLGAADYTTSFAHELLIPADTAPVFELSTEAVGAFQPSTFRGSEPTKTRISVIGLIRDALRNRTPANFRFLDLGCGDGEILAVIHSQLAVPWPNLWGVTAEDLRGFFDTEQPGFEPALQEAFSSWRGWKGSEKKWVTSTIAGRERTLGRIASAKRSHARTNLHRLAPAEWNDTNYVIHDIQQLKSHRDIQETVAREGKFDVIASFTTFCYLPDCLGAVEMIYNTLLADNGGTFVANAINKSCLMDVTDGPSESVAGDLSSRPFAELATKLQGLGFDFHVFEERADKILLLMRKHQRSPPQMQLGSVLEYIESPADANHEVKDNALATCNADARPVYRLKQQPKQ